MGFYAEFYCTYCGYKTEELYDAIGYHCDHCKKIYSHYNYYTWMESVKKGKEICPKCKISTLRLWDDDKCPWCGQLMTMNPTATGSYI